MTTYQNEKQLTNYAVIFVLSQVIRHSTQPIQINVEKCLLYSDTMQSGRNVQIFWRNLLASIFKADFFFFERMDITSHSSTFNMEAPDSSEMLINFNLHHDITTSKPAFFTVSVARSVT